MSNPSRPRLAFLRSLWHDDIVDRAREGFTEVAGDRADLEFFSVPGAFEIPLFVRNLADTGVPVFSCVLTPQQFHEHEDHVRFFTEHMLGKGRDCARSALETLVARAALV